jgi:hypothetical protein
VHVSLQEWVDFLPRDVVRGFVRYGRLGAFTRKRHFCSSTPELVSPMDTIGLGAPSKDEEVQSALTDCCSLVDWRQVGVQWFAQGTRIQWPGHCVVTGH